MLMAVWLQVAVGDLHLDQGELLWRRRVALKNVPRGRCTLLLSPSDLGNFMTHPIMTQAAAKVRQCYTRLLPSVTASEDTVSEAKILQLQEIARTKRT
jgi:hypothetical protein